MRQGFFVLSFFVLRQLASKVSNATWQRPVAGGCPYYPLHAQTP
jgi:hypothetical protein